MGLGLKFIRIYIRPRFAGEYRGNAYAKHVLIGQQTTIKEIHFLHWLQLFQEEAVKHLPTEAANAITQRAALIAESLKQGMLT